MNKTEMADIWDQLQSDSSNLFDINQGLHYFGNRGYGFPGWVSVIELRVLTNDSFAWRGIPGIPGASWTGS